MAGFHAYCDYLESLTHDTLDRLDEYVHENVRFKDPFNDVSGAPAMRAILSDMFEQVSDLQFVIHRRLGNAPEAAIEWTLSGQLMEKPWSVDGTSVLTFDENGLLTAHIDYWDAASGLYERFPVIGWLLRGLRRRLQISPVDQ